MGRGMNEELLIQITEDGADAQRLATLAGHLRNELLRLDVADVTAQRNGAAPPGARVVDPATVGALLVDLGESVTVLQSVISLVKAWLGRGQRTGRRVRLELDGNVIELSQASEADQARLEQLYIDAYYASRSRP
jgi:hypothetical protein